MFCTSCGRRFAEADRFCGGCGRPRPEASASDQDLPISEQNREGMSSSPTELDWSWEKSFNYKRIIQARVVQDIFDSAQRRGKQGIGLNDYLDLLTPVLPSPGKAIFSVSSKLGVNIVENTNLAHHHEICRRFEQLPGHVIASLACALAGRKCDVFDIRQGSDRLTIHSLIPATLFRGQFVLEARVSAEGNQTIVILILKALLGGLVKNKSQRIADEIFGDVILYSGEIESMH